MDGKHHGRGHEQADRREALLGVVGQLAAQALIDRQSGATIKML